jgi:hypothetical protein
MAIDMDIITGITMDIIMGILQDMHVGAMTQEMLIIVDVVRQEMVDRKQEQGSALEEVI